MSRVKLNIILFIVLFFLVSVSGCGKNITEKVKAFFGEEILDIIKSPDQVFSFKVSPKKTRIASKNMLYKYRIIEKGPILSKDQIETIQEVLFDENTYDFKWAKKAFIFPTFALEFQKDNQKLLLFIDFSRKEFLFVHNNKESVEDFDNAISKVKELTNQLFNDKKE